MDDLAACLRPTWFLDSDAAPVREFAERTVRGVGPDVDRAVALYYAVRDGIRYDPYALSRDRGRYRASTVLTLPAAYCIQKAVLFGAASRAIGIPSRLGFADVRNHLTSPKLREAMGKDVFVFHGFTELHIEGRWVKATPAFDLGLCQRFAVLPLEFDGRQDSLLHPFDAENRRHMEYLRQRGSFVDLPFDEIMGSFREHYPRIFERLGADVEDELFRPARSGPAG
ncbi:MAG: transglutaminase domain-containing protein [Deltaproteobacteria bacterium]|nr:transglutaminase domain-containing protein [Deltaproteobacteria bacterium]